MRRGSPVLVLIFLLFAFGCGGDSDDPSSPTPNPVEGATLSTTQAASLARVSVLGLPAAQKAAAPAYAAALATEGADEISLPLENDEGGWYFVAPLHPVTPNQGGLFQVRIREGSNESPPQPLEVEPLPQASGAFASLVATMREHLELHAGLSGTSLTELKSTAPGDVPPALLPLKLAQSYLDSDADPHDLTDLAANEDDFLDAETADLLDRMFGYFDLEAYLRAQIDELEGQELATLPASPQKFARRACIDVGPDIGTAPELSQAMIRSAVTEIGADPNSTPGRILDAGGTMMSGISVVPAFGLAAAVGGIALSEVQAVMGGFAGIYPSYFVSLVSHVDKTEFNEDSTEFATYSNVKVVAASTGWSADKIVANVVINLLGGVLSELEKAKILGSDLARDVAALGLGAGAAEVFDGTGIIEFCPRQWTVDISSPLYCTAAALNHRFDVDIPGQKVTPREVGPDQLRVAAQAPKFGGRSVHQDTAMQVKQIQVVVLPDEIVVESPGQNIEITATIHNADLTTLRWTPEWGNWEDGLGDDTNDGGTRTLRTPATPSAYPFLVRVESLTRNGIRESGIPARIGYATIRYDDPRIRIEPQYACIAPGQTQQFTATVTGIEEYTVVWSIVEGYGSINQNGLYQSLGAGTSNAVIEAKLQENQEVSDTADVDAANCNCSVDIAISGDAVWSRQGSQAAYLVSDFGDLFYQFFFDLGGDGFPNISASIGGVDEKPSPRPGDTGTWKVSFAYVTASESWTSIWDDEKVPLPGVSVNITELTESYMVGTFTGNAFQLDEQGEISSIVGVDVEFRAGYWDGGEWPCD